MKRFLLLSAVVLMAVVGCTKNEAIEHQNGKSDSEEIAVAAFNGDAAQRTKGYTTDSSFEETYRAALHEASPATYARDMRLSAYLYPQNGEQKNYFVGKTYAKGASDALWHADPAIYWPVGGTMDFLAYSLSGEEGSSKNVTAVWNSDNAAKQVVLTVPGENTQNDILFASAAGIKSSDKKAVDLQFNHAQAWLEFAVTGSPAGIVHLQKIELEDVYNAGTLTISNNSGNAVAAWNFKGEDRQNITVDNFNVGKDLTAAPMYFDMLIPQQTKTNFVIYYTLGTDTKVLQYRFGTDLKTWLMGEKYVYNINISTSEVTVNPIVTSWEPAVIETSYTVSIKSGDSEKGSVSVSNVIGGKLMSETKAAEPSSSVYLFDTWGGQATLKAEPKEGCIFLWWSDGETNPERTITVTESNDYEAVFSYEITANLPVGYVYGNAPTVEYLDDSKAMLTAGGAPAETSFAGWIKEGGDGTVLSEEAVYVTVPSEITAATNFIPVFKSVSSSKYVDIITGLNDDKTVKSHTKWAKQNLSISDSGKMSWKGGSTSAVKVPGTDEDVRNGDYFMWATYAGYCGDATDADKGLLIYTKFTSTKCVGGGTKDAFTCKADMTFDFYKFPYYNNPILEKYTGESGDGKTVLEPEDDAASIILGSSWHTPTIEEFQALQFATYWAWDATDQGYYVYSPKSNEDRGCYNSSSITYKKDEALLFFPASGGGNVKALNNLGVGMYWSSSLDLDSHNQNASILAFMSDWVDSTWYSSTRCYGKPVRPVSD